MRGRTPRGPRGLTEVEPGRHAAQGRLVRVVPLRCEDPEPVPDEVLERAEPGGGAGDRPVHLPHRPVTL